MNHSGKTTCNICHATGTQYVVSEKRKIGSHQSSTRGQDCSDCHTKTTTWYGALGGRPDNHIPYNAGVACNFCHTSNMTGSGLHEPYLVPKSGCEICHVRSSIYSTWVNEVWEDEHSGEENKYPRNNCSNSSCHAPLGPEGSPYGSW
jgi:hypothetical protein